MALELKVRAYFCYLPAAAFVLRVLPDDPLRIVDGMAVGAEGAANGLAWNERASARYRVG